MTTFSAASFRTVGNNTGVQNLMVLFNGGANRIVNVLYVGALIDLLAGQSGDPAIFYLSRISSYSGGIALPKVQWTDIASHADIAAVGSCNTDGGSLTAITASPQATLWNCFVPRLASAGGQIVADETRVFPTVGNIVLRQNQGLMISVEHQHAGTNNSSNTHYAVQMLWNEVVP